MTPLLSDCCVGCGGRAVQLHHVVRRQDLRRAAGRDTAWFQLLVADQRGLVAVCLVCHAGHHSRMAPLRLSVLPDEVFVFAADVLGAGKAFNLLERTYAGEDARLNMLLEPLSSRLV